MNTTSRREFLERSAIVGGAAWALARAARLSAYPLDGVMGLQSPMRIGSFRPTMNRPAQPANENWSG